MLENHVLSTKLSVPSILLRFEQDRRSLQWCWDYLDGDDWLIRLGIIRCNRFRSHPAIPYACSRTFMTAFPRSQQVIERLSDHSFSANEDFQWQLAVPAGSDSRLSCAIETLSIMTGKMKMESNLEGRMCLVKKS